MNNFFDIQSIIGNLANPLSGSNQASSSAQTGSRQPANPPLVIPLPQNCQTIPRPENLQGLNNNNPINLNAANPSNANPLSSLLGTLSVINLIFSSFIIKSERRRLSKYDGVDS